MSGTFVSNGVQTGLTLGLGPWGILTLDGRFFPSFQMQLQQVFHLLKNCRAQELVVEHNEAVPH